MGIATFPSVSSPIKSIQRGTAASAGNISITAVDTTKTVCNSFSTGSAGSVAATGTINAFSGVVSATSTSGASINATTLGGFPNTSARSAYPLGTFGTYNGRYGAYDMGSINRSIAATNFNGQNINAANVNSNATNITGGSTSLTSAVYGIYLVNSTTITATGPCRYEVVEYY